jgi:dinuclear metal center YbgI/SA1388 family protein
MIELQAVCDFLQEFAPAHLAEDWDNVGLLVGDPSREVKRIMTCLTVTPASAGEAVRQCADLIVTHHPLPFRPLKRLTTDSTPSRLLLELIGAGIAVYSPHTAFDSAAGGINQRLAEGLGLEGIAPLVSNQQDVLGLGAGRYGTLDEDTELMKLAGKLKAFLSLDGLHMVGSPNRRISRVAVACGAAGEFLEPARRAECDALVTGETSFHTCLEAEATDVALLLPGHYASERFAVELLAEELSRQFDELTVWASRDERDPLRWV